jgi:hypothetical protein
LEERIGMETFRELRWFHWLRWINTIHDIANMLLGAAAHANSSQIVFANFRPFG